MRGDRLYSDILNAGFAHIVSFNVDLRLLGGISSSQVRHRAGSSFLERHVQLQIAASQRTNVWFPYGNTTDPKSIQLGHLDHDKRLMSLENYRDGMMDRWFVGSPYEGYWLQEPADAYYRLWDQIRSWYDLFFLAPLVFVGVSLPLDDWPLWWLLHQRARNFVPFRKTKRERCPATFYLTRRGEDLRHLAGRPAEIDIVEFRSYSTLWAFLRNAFSTHGRYALAASSEG